LSFVLTSTDCGEAAIDAPPERWILSEFSLAHADQPRHIPCAPKAKSGSDIAVREQRWVPGDPCCHHPGHATASISEAVLLDGEFVGYGTDDGGHCWPADNPLFTGMI